MVAAESIEVQVRLFGFGQRISQTPKKAVTLPKGARMVDLLEHLEAESGLALPENLVIILNGRHTPYSKGGVLGLSDQDQVTLMQPMVGGCGRGHKEVKRLKL